MVVINDLVRSILESDKLGNILSAIDLTTVLRIDGDPKPQGLARNLANGKRKMGGSSPSGRICFWRIICAVRGDAIKSKSNYKNMTVMANCNKIIENIEEKATYKWVKRPRTTAGSTSFDAKIWGESSSNKSRTETTRRQVTVYIRPISTHATARGLKDLFCCWKDIIE